MHMKGQPLACRLTGLVVGIAAAMCPAHALAGELDDTRPFTTLALGKNLSMRISSYIQARVEYGDLAQGPAQSVRTADADLYFRRARIGFSGSALLPGLSYGFSFAGDESAQAEIYSSYDGEGGVTLSDAYVRYAVSDALVLKFGKDKLPYSRIYLTSSAEQLFSERPYYTYALRSYFHTYTHSHASVSGKVLDGTLGYSVALGRAWRYGDRLNGASGPVVIAAAPELAARLEWSPPGWVEARRSDAHIGQGRHLAFGVFGAMQNGLQYETAAGLVTEQRPFYGTDVSYHDGPLTLQGEYNGWRTGSAAGGGTEGAQGVYVQGAYLCAGLMLEPALRIEWFKQQAQDSSGAATVMTLGLNRYVKGQDLKFTLDWEHSRFIGDLMLLRPLDRDTRNVLRLTAQFVL